MQFFNIPGTTFWVRLDMIMIVGQKLTKDTKGNPVTATVVMAQFPGGGPMREFYTDSSLITVMDALQQGLARANQK